MLVTHDRSEGRCSTGANAASEGERRAERPTAPEQGTDPTADVAERTVRRRDGGKGRGVGRRATTDGVGPPRTPIEGFVDALANYCARLDVAEGRGPP